jgi:hypothetical protein
MPDDTMPTIDRDDVIAQANGRYAFRDGDKYVVISGKPDARMKNGWLWHWRVHVDTEEQARNLVNG